MTQVTNCLIRSQTLAAGETFVLPAGAVLIGASNEDNITSTCSIPPLETLQCYAVLLASVGSDSDGKREYFEASQQKVVAIELNGQYFPFGTGEVINDAVGGFYNMNIIWERINQYVPGCQFNGVTYDVGNDENDARRSVLSIKTIPSIGNNLQLVIHAIANMQPGDGVSDVRYLARFMSHTELAAHGWRNLPPCN